MSARGGSPPKKLAYVDPAKFTPHFAWKKSARDKDVEHVFCEGVDLVGAAESFSTPTYCYSRTAIGQAYREFDSELGRIPHTICFAVKSNGNLSLLNDLAKRGSGFDIVSGGELEHLGHLGVRGDRIVFSGVGKTRDEIREALQYRIAANRKSKRDRGQRGILLFNLESEAELEVLLEEASRSVGRGSRPPWVSIRVNPDVQAGGHPHISTGRHQHKFGLTWEEARRLYLAHADSHWICWQGISVHIGSQIVTLDPFRQALQRLASYFCDLRSHGILLRFLDFGGGLGVRYTNEKPPAREVYARMIAQILEPLHTHLLLEPGRTIIGPTGVLLTRVLYVKESRGKTFVVVDAGMNDLMRPVLYGAVHPITRVTRGGQRGGRQRVDVVGPVCETGDCFLRDWPLDPVAPGDVLAIWVAGAYGMSQSSNYNGRCRAAEVLVEGAKFRVIRKRETLDDLVRGQIF